MCYIDSLDYYRAQKNYKKISGIYVAEIRRFLSDAISLSGVI
jgi:hypothetical protein